MDRLIIENVRCFRGRHEVPLAPLTILVGENSTGKSTLLAMARLAWDVVWGKPLNFNEDPFLMGAYSQIASFGEPTSQFKIGSIFLVSDSARRALPVEIVGEFASYKGQPALRFWRFGPERYKIEAEFHGAEELDVVRFHSPSGEGALRMADAPFAPRAMMPSMANALLSEMAKISSISMRDQAKISRISHDLPRLQRPYAFAPIRTSPQRTYDPIREIENPQGGHVPMVLASMHLRSSKEWYHLQEALNDFGSASGLFEEVDVRRLGGSEADPFQLQFKVDGTLINLIDVGYGVSQILPILVDCLRGEQGRMFLLQQPEVHLHPKAQAELGSFMAALAKQQNKKFLIETHSDYLVDRIRMDIRDKKHNLRPEDVAFLYFERQAGEVQIHRLLLDERGDIVNAPAGYRKFILQEERRFLGI